MPGMKVTVDAAMRARDVSRSQPHHDAAAEAAIADMPTLRGTPGTRVTPVPAPITRAAEPARPGPPAPRRRPGPPVPGPADQPVPARNNKPAPPPVRTLAPQPASAPQPSTSQNAAPAEAAHQGEPGSRGGQPPPDGQPGRDNGGASAPGRPRRKRVRRRRSHGH
jgi:translation initiation factor IF-2